MIYTLGHSTRSLEEFIAILKQYKISLVVDIRTIPRSRHNPQFNEDYLAGKLTKAGIEYIHFAKLGGLRRVQKDSINLGWKNDSFRGYADYMQTDEFSSALFEIIELAEKENLALICAETLWWRCHRRLVADALVAKGNEVTHILNINKTEPHKLTPWLEVAGGKIIYPKKRIKF